MFGTGKRFRLFTLGGVPIMIDTSFLIAVGLISFLLLETISTRFPTIESSRSAALTAIAAIVFFGQILLHELAHAAMAKVRGIKVEGITLVLFGGFTSGEADRDAGSSFLISFVGPATSLVIGFALWFFARGRPFEPLAWTLAYMGAWVIFIAIFNFLPGFPLDGGRMLLGAIWGLSHNKNLAVKVSAVAGQLVGVGLGAFGIYLALVQQNVIGGLWLAWIAKDIFQGARSFVQSENARTALKGAKVTDAMMPPPATVQDAISLIDALEQFLRGHEHEMFPVVDGSGRLAGALNYEGARRVGENEPTRPVRDAMIPLADLKTVTAGQPLIEVAQGLGGAAALVVDDGVLVGIISAHSINNWVAARSTTPAR